MVNVRKMLGKPVRVYRLFRLDYAREKRRELRRD